MHEFTYLCKATVTYAFEVTVTAEDPEAGEELALQELERQYDNRETDHWNDEYSPELGNRHVVYEIQPDDPRVDDHG